MRSRRPSSGSSRPIASCAKRTSALSIPCAGSASHRSGNAPMRHILRQREWRADDWHYPGEACTEADPLIVPLAQLRSDAAQWQSRAGPLGVRLGPADAVDELAALLPRLALIAVEFPSPGDGRGYSQARM